MQKEREEIVTDDQALAVFIKIFGFSRKELFEVVRLEDRRVVWRKNYYGSRAFETEMDVMDDGRLYVWRDLKPTEVFI